MNNAIYGKTKENLRNRIDVKLVKKDYLKCISKPSYMPHKIFDNNVVAIRKSKLALKLNKPAYDNKPKLSFTDTDSLMYEIKTEDVYEDFSSNKGMFNFGNCSTKSKYHNDSNKLVIGKMKDETRGVAIEELVGMKPKMYSFLVDNNEHK